jgi:hypothetical protein
VAKFVWVGRNDANKGGSSAKAYTIRRSGKTVVTTFGAIQVVGARGGRYFWRSKEPVQDVWRFGNEREAKLWVSEQSAKKEAKGYDRLPGRVRIRPRRAGR